MSNGKITFSETNFFQSASCFAMMLTTIMVGIGAKKGLSPDLMAKIAIGVAAPMLAINSFAAIQLSQAEPESYETDPKKATRMKLFKWHEAGFTGISLLIASTMIGLSIFALKGKIASNHLALGMIGTFLSGTSVAVVGSLVKLAPTLAEDLNL